MNAYAAFSDKFKLDEHYESQSGLAFPCCVCAHREGTHFEFPCVECGHNAAATFYSDEQ